MSTPLSELRQAPSAVDAEQAVLGGLMLSPESLAKVSDWLVESDFYRQDHRMIFRAVTTLIDRKSPVDPVTMADWFESNGLAEHVGGMAYLIELTDSTHSTANLVAYAEIVVEKSRLRAAIEAGVTLTEAAWSKGADSQLVIAQASHNLAQMQVSKMRGGLEHPRAAMNKLYADMTARYERGPGLKGIPTPWTEFNDWTGGMEESTLYLLGARPSMGKSAFGLQLALHAASLGHRTAFFSIEMSDKQCMARAVSCHGSIPFKWVRNPDSADPDADLYWGRLSSSMAAILDMPLLLDGTPAITHVQLSARARRAHMQAPLKLIIVDHIHDMKIDTKRDARFEFGDIAQAGKTLAKDLDCAVVMLCQLNRKLEDRANKRPMMADLRESGDLEQKADVIAFLYRDEVYDPESALKGSVEVIRGKGRDLGIGAPIFLEGHLDVMQMRDWIGPKPVKSDSTYKPKSNRGLKA